MIKYDTRVQLTDIVRGHFVSFTTRCGSINQASDVIMEETGISMGNATIANIKSRGGMQKTIALPVYMLMCPDELLAKELGSIQKQGVPKLVQVYAEQNYPRCSYEDAIPLIAKEIEYSLGIKSSTVENLLDTTIQRKKPAAIDVAIPIYLASNLDIISDYTGILASLGYKLIKPKGHPPDEEDDSGLVAEFMAASGMFLAVAEKSRHNPDGTVSINTTDWDDDALKGLEEK